MTYAEIVRAVKRYGYAIVAKDFDGTKWLAVARADPELPAGVSIYLTFREIRPSVWTLTVDYIACT
jgi:phage major head subunit gpT-like protein